VRALLAFSAMNVIRAHCSVYPCISNEW